ncbi:hypothetical protein ABH15_07210 [Methanoculleus taiwanensis]|uniref:PAS domain-containing protein n=2 Tax=Methanoculleus taiwanensis TaxID=1550565 RepID=A0A498H030_9EURY|nr:hypothetical protein ABH15_07210 [Methanoculleus taiwanensis]
MGVMTKDRISTPENDAFVTVPWGTQIGMLYRNRQELAELAVPFVRAAVERNAACICLTSAPFGIGDAQKALRRVIPGLDEQISSGRITLRDCDEVFSADGRVDPESVVNRWIADEEQALEQGYTGVFLLGTMPSPETENAKAFCRAGATLHRIIDSRRIVALCTYSLRRCGISGIVDVAAGHDFMLIKQNGRWRGVEQMPRRRPSGRPCTGEERIRHIAHTSADVVFICDGEGTITFISHAVEKVFGYAAGEVIGRNLREFLLPPFDRELERFWTTLAGEPEGGWLQAELVRADGSRSVVEIYASPITGHDLVIGYEGVCRDVTDQVVVKKHAYDQIEKNIEQFAILGDHLRHPLQVILGWADLMEDEQSEQIRQQVRKINETVRQLDEGWLESRKVREFLLKNEPPALHAPEGEKKAARRRKKIRRTRKEQRLAEAGARQQTLSRYMTPERAGPVR